MNDELEHFGVKGMKWGVRKSQNENYSTTQRRRDTTVYGRRGANRINKNMNKGDSISTARSLEKTRRDRVMGRNKYVRQGGKVAGAAVGIVGTNLLINQIPRIMSTRGAQAASRLLTGDDTTSNFISVLSQTPMFRLIASAGAAKVADMFAGDIAVAANMAAAGYDPSRR